MNQKKHSKGPISISRDKFECICKLFEWRIGEVHRKYWGEIPELQRRQDIFAVVVSGCDTYPKTLNDINDSIAGMDVLCCEKKPKVHEPEGNAYHYVFTKTPDPGLILMYGPFIKETLVPHWFNEGNLSVYG